MSHSRGKEVAGVISEPNRVTLIKLLRPDEGYWLWHRVWANDEHNHTTMA